ncbi:GxxExxY protein [archaeon]|nr:MAG: GxxExxY protein [archaeon]
MERKELEKLIYDAIGAMIEVHKEMGPGFVEGVYRRSTCIEFMKRDIPFESEKEIILRYKGERVGKHRLDLFVADKLVIELKTVEQLVKKHYAQVRSYLKAVEKPIGLLVNFSDFQLDARRVEIEP